MTETTPLLKAKKKPVLAAVSRDIPAEALHCLQHTMASVVLLPPDPLLPAPVASHADMLLFSIGDALVVHRSYYDIARTEIDTILCLTGLQLVLTDCPRGDTYPLDIALNALLCGRFLFGRMDVLAPEILTLAEENGITPVHVKQGYAGCSGLAVGEAIATADPSLAKAAQTHGIPIIPAPDRDILLPGYDHGFFGGCGGVWENQIFLCGTPDEENYAVFHHYISCQKMTVHCLSPTPLFDCGGIKLFPV